MTPDMWIALVSVFLANLGTLVAAVWKLSSALSSAITKVITRLDGIKELMDVNNQHTAQRITAMESTISLQNQTIADIQKRQTTMELEMKLTLKKE